MNDSDCNSEHSSQIEGDETASRTEYEDGDDVTTSHQGDDLECALQSDTFALSENPSRYGRVSRKRKILEQLSTCMCGTKATPQASNATKCSFSDCEAKW
ncbi:hypothetical protein FRC12_005104, partial [Ceratobasidium sp. 428]